MTPRRQRLLEDLPLRGLSERTQERSVRAVRPLAHHYHTSPERIPEEARRASFLYLKNEKPYARRASPLALGGLTFFYEPTLKRAWTTLTFVRPPQAHKLPVLLSLEEVHTLLRCVRLPRYRACLRTLYAWGLRLQEGTHLQGPDLDRARMFVHVRDGQGAKAR